MKQFLKFITVAVVMATAGNAYALVPVQERRWATKAELDRNATNALVLDGTIGCALDVDSCYTKHGSVWYPRDFDGPEYLINFNEGAGKGFSTIQLDGTVRDGATGIYNIAYFSRGSAAIRGAALVFESLGAGQTLDIAMAATGLDLTGDQADNEGFELQGGILGASGRPLYPGTDPAFKACATITITDVSDTDDLHFGFRKPETVNATFTSYNTYYAIGIVASAATAAIQTSQQDDAGGNTNTDTTLTWADTETKVLCVLASSAGVASVTVNGAVATGGTFTFDDGEPIEPFFWWIHAGAADCVPVISSWSVAYQ